MKFTFELSKKDIDLICLAALKHAPFSCVRIVVDQGEQSTNHMAVLQILEAAKNDTTWDQDAEFKELQEVKK